MSGEAILALIGLFLAATSSAVTGVVYLLRQNEAIKMLLYEKIQKLEDEYESEIDHHKDRIQMVHSQIRDIKSRFSTIESALGDLNGWAYKQGYVPKRFFRGEYPTSDQDSINAKQRDEDDF